MSKAKRIPRDLPENATPGTREAASEPKRDIREVDSPREGVLAYHYTDGTSQEYPLTHDNHWDQPKSTYDPATHKCDLGDYCDFRRLTGPFTGASCGMNPPRPAWQVTAPEGMVLVEDEYGLARASMTGEVGDPEADAVAEIKEWWIRTASDDSIATAEKYREYGATSLSDMGYEMAELMGLPRPTKAQAQELAVYYFLKGKMARLKTAILKSEQASDDTWLDITCYAMIARKARASGGWPNGGV